MATFLAEKSGGVKKKPMIILKEFIFFVLFQQAASETGRRAMIHTEKKRTTFVFHKIVIYIS